MKIERLPLNALRAFSEAVEAESFKAAAERLGVTPGAVSRQIRQLEERLGIALFERQAHGVRVTEAGRILSRDVSGGLARIAEGVRNIEKYHTGVARLTLNAPPSFAQLWLLPRLEAFEARESRLDITLEAEQALISPAWQGSGARLALRYGRGPWPGVKSLRLFGDALFPVCSPALLERLPILAPADLLEHSLLEVNWGARQGGNVPGWRDWFHAAGLEVTDRPIKRQYSLYGMALDQAMAGHGVMLASYPVVADRLANGGLVRPFGADYVIDSSYTYNLILPASGQAPPTVQQFIDWLLEEAAAFSAGFPDTPPLS
ncbi:LysR substrate-binding domain-containing protein [Kushneria phosphatilytica]|uniref:LysR family transcriptional regulator n=1 Tax=Kushneria phosphatilytica TaxID=657387 RepID=A0A1S1NYA6_9GAMM|nr:LysR substrate-binding domain-containing protein [Kushneria phosphatilytica]OHV10014.1 LysR family transcriptional regulator [Kushneria phosphatilytica]QEL11699.1 LysR family transcriptional regulator [Kushneria phosphatilytica]